MIHTIIKESLRDNSITAEQFYILDMLQNDKESLYPYLKNQLKFKNNLMQNLYRRGFIEIEKADLDNIGLSNDIKITSKGKSLFVEPVKTDMSWFSKWYDLWPSGVRSGSYYVRSGEADCKKKLTKFVEKHTEFTEDMIMKATNNYLNRMAAKGFAFMQLATNFISKDGVSTLAAECEAIETNSEPQSFTRDV